MVLIRSTTKLATGTIFKGIPEVRSTLESDGETSCSSTETAKDTLLLRQTTASIADALLKLGNSDDSSSSPTHKRKRAVSLAAESMAAGSDAASTSSQSTETDADMHSTHEHANKRQRKSSTPPSQVVCSVPKKLCHPDTSKSALNMMRQRMNSKLSDDNEEEQALSFSTSEFQSEVQIKHSERKIPGDIGCISQMFHQDFRPLMAAPRMPREIVPEDKPQMPCMRSNFAPPANPATMYSTAITEHRDCLIMHSYTVLPRMITPHMALAQLTNGM